MKKIEAVIRIEKLDDVVEALKAVNAPGMMIERIEGCGRQKGITEQFRGREYKVDFLPKIRLGLVVHDSDVRKFIGVIADTARTGEVGDGKVFVYPVEAVMRIRTGEEGDPAV
jgi:nitrogen regulatory protein P-II 1